jgi:hypothetical protein
MRRNATDRRLALDFSPSVFSRAETSASSEGSLAVDSCSELAADGAKRSGKGVTS